MDGVAVSDHGSDSARAKETAVFVIVVAAVADQLIGPSAGPAD
jgi:hypothetical protein